MNARVRILEVAAELVAQSPDAEVSTRAVCDAAGVTAPTLYHHFGDKDGLLNAVVTFGLNAFLEAKRASAATVREHVADDIRVGWDTHLEFARENPNFYKLMCSPRGRPAHQVALGEAYRLLSEHLELGASKGQLRVSTQTGALMILSAVTGVALTAINEPQLFNNPNYVSGLREAIIAVVTVGSERTDLTTYAGAQTMASTAAMLKSKIAIENSPLTVPERALMDQWLTTLADAGASALSN